jgi:hypothetical protein
LSALQSKFSGGGANAALWRLALEISELPDLDILMSLLAALKPQP